MSACGSFVPPSHSGTLVLPGAYLYYFFKIMNAEAMMGIYDAVDSIVNSAIDKCAHSFKTYQSAFGIVRPLKNTPYSIDK